MPVPLFYFSDKDYTHFRALLFLFGNPLVCKALVAACKMDYSAVFEAAFLQRAPHGRVVAVSVDAKALAFLGTKIHAEVHNSPSLLCHGDAVNNAVGRVREPRAAVDLGVGGIGLGGEHKDGEDSSIILTDVAHAALHILARRLGAWAAAIPLIRVAALAHKALGILIYLADGRKIGLLRFSDYHSSLAWCLFSFADDGESLPIQEGAQKRTQREHRAEPNEVDERREIRVIHKNHIVDIVTAV